MEVDKVGVFSTKSLPTAFLPFLEFAEFTRGEGEWRVYRIPRALLGKALAAGAKPLPSVSPPRKGGPR